MMSVLLKALEARILSSNVTNGFMKDFNGRVYISKAPADVDLPLCIVVPTVERAEQHANGKMLVVSVLFQMYASADSTAGLETAQSHLRTLLDNIIIKPTDYDRLSCRLRQQGAPVQDDDAWSVEDEYELRGTLTS